MKFIKTRSKPNECSLAVGLKHVGFTGTLREVLSPGFPHREAAMHIILSILMTECRTLVPDFPGSILRPQVEEWYEWCQV